MKNRPTLPVVCYEPTGSQGAGLRVFLRMAEELWKFRELLRELVRRDFRVRRRSSFLGLFWSLAHPAALVAVFVWLKNSRLVFEGDVGMPYALYAYLGVLHWNLFSSLLAYSAGSLLNASNLVAKVKFPRETLVLAACARAVVDWLLALPVLAVLFWWVGVVPAWPIVFAPVALVPLILLGAGLGMLLAVVALPVRDVVQALPLALAPLLFLSPVLYELPVSGAWPTLRALNPVAAVLDMLRGLCVSVAPESVQAWLVWCLISLFVFLSCWRVFHGIVKRIPEYA